MLLCICDGMQHLFLRRSHLCLIERAETLSHLFLKNWKTSLACGALKEARRARGLAPKSGTTAGRRGGARTGPVRCSSVGGKHYDRTIAADCLPFTVCLRLMPVYSLDILSSGWFEKRPNMFSPHLRIVNKLELCKCPHLVMRPLWAGCGICLLRFSWSCFFVVFLLPFGVFVMGTVEPCFLRVPPMKCPR